MVLVDSSVWIEALRRRGSLEVKCAVEVLLDEYEATMSSPTRLEVLGGARESERRELNQRFSVLPYLRVHEDDFTAATQQAWTLAKKGIRVPWFDLLTAAIALRANCRVFSIDKHFEEMKTHLGLTLYEPGYGGKFSPESNS